jgi:hypothetical protein
MYIEDLNSEEETSYLDDGIIHITIEIIEYTAGSDLTKTVIKKYHNSVCTMSFESKQCLKKRSRPFDNFIQAVAGNVEIIINETPVMLDLGHGIVVPAHSPYYLKPDSYFKIINTMVHQAEV